MSTVSILLVLLSPFALVALMLGAEAALGDRTPAAIYGGVGFVAVAVMFVAFGLA